MGTMILDDVVGTVPAWALIAALLAPVAIPAEGGAQTPPFAYIRTKLATEYPRDVRNIGMAGAGVADIGGVSTGYYNPARLGWNGAVTVEGAINQYVMDIDFYDAGVSGFYRPGGGDWSEGWRFGWAASYWAYVMPDLEERTIYMPEGTATDRLRAYYLTGALAAAYKVGKIEIGVGQATKHLEYPPYDLSAWMFDIGVLCAMELEGERGFLARPRIGLSVKDLGSGLTTPEGRELEFIQRYRVGAGMDLSPPNTTMLWGREVRALSLSLNLDVAFDDAGDDEYMEDRGIFAVGAELVLAELLSLRVGTSDDIFPWNGSGTFGLGLGWRGDRFLFMADYGLALTDTPLDDSSALHNFRLAVGMIY